MENQSKLHAFFFRNKNENIVVDAIPNRKDRRKTARYCLLFFLSFIIPVCILVAILARLQVFPDGESTVLTADLAAQYTDFFSYFKGFFNGENNLFYCLSQTLGNNIWGVLPYYLLSPFNLVLLFFSSEALPTAIYIITVLKIGACGVTCFLFLNRVFHGEYAALIFSTCYALMSFNVVYLSHIMWLDGVILLPVISLGIHRMLEKKRPLCYILSLFLALVTNYYIGYMLCIFTVVYFLYRILRALPQQEKWKYFWQKAYMYMISSFIAGGMAAVVLLPAFMALNGGKSNGFKGLSFAFNGSVFEILGNLYTNMFSLTEAKNDWFDGLPNIFVGIFILVLTVLFFIQKPIALKTKLLTGSLIAVFILSFWVAPLDLAWQGFTPPNWFPHRYAFLFSFVLVTLAFESFGVLRTQKPPAVRYCVTGTAMLAATILLAWLTGRLHSGMKFVLLDAGLVVLFFILLYFVHLQTKKWLQFALTLGMGVICTGNITLNANMVLRRMDYGSYGEYAQYYEDATPVIEKTKAMTQGDFARMEKDFFYTFNDAMHYSYHGITHYSSNLKVNLMHFFGKTGYKSNDVVISNSQGNTLAFDSIYGVRYFISGQSSFPQYRKVLQEGGYSVYENPFALGLGFTIPEEVAALELDEENPFLSQNRVLHCFAPQIRQEVFTAETLLNTQTDNLTVTSENGNMVLEKIDPEQPASICWTYQRDEACSPVYMCFGNAERARKITVKVNDEPVYYDHNYHGAFYDYIHPVLLNDTAETYTVSLELTAERFVVGKPYLYRQNMQVFEQYYSAMADGNFAATENNGSSFSGQVVAKEQERLFFSLPYERGWSVYIDGQKVETEAVFDTFLSVKIPAGKHTVELSFIPPGLFMGSVVSGVSILALGGYLWLLHRGRIG